MEGALHLAGRAGIRFLAINPIVDDAVQGRLQLIPVSDGRPGVGRGRFRAWRYRVFTDVATHRADSVPVGLAQLDFQRAPGWLIGGSGSIPPAVLRSHSFGVCSRNRRHVDGQLSDAMRHLTAGLAVGAPAREEQLRLDGRAALMRVYHVNLDGVALQMGIVVLNKDICTYDMVYLAPTSRFEDGWASFVQTISGFQVF